MQTNDYRQISVIVVKQNGKRHCKYYDYNQTFTIESQFNIK